MSVNTSEKEYLVHIWGGAWNSDANPSIEKDLGIKEGYHYFKTKTEVDNFIVLLDNPIYKNQGLMVSTKYGYMTHKRTIFVGTLKYKDQVFIIHRDFGYEYSEKDAVSMFEDGNYSCDCNRSLFIRNEYGDDSIPFLPCGNKIELLDYRFEYVD